MPFGLRISRRKKTPPSQLDRNRRFAALAVAAVIVLSVSAVYNGLLHEPNDALAALKIAAGVLVLFVAAYLAVRHRERLTVLLTGRSAPFRHPDPPAPEPSGERPPGTR